jgi:hypothetical protein
MNASRAALLALGIDHVVFDAVVRPGERTKYSVKMGPWRVIREFVR